MKMKELVQEGWKLLDITNDEKLKAEYDSWCRKVKGFLNQNGFPKGKLNEIQIKMWYTENEFCKDDTRNSIIKAIKDTVVYLDEINTISEAVISEAVGIRLIEQILNNFYLYYRSMFQNPLHKKATMSMDELKKIQIGNEYDLQRMLYALLVPIFPLIRQEAESDNGYGGMRADLYLEEYDLIIETKCTRASMIEKKLLEELGADGFHYKAKTVFFFVYDKKNIIKNPDVFKAAFVREQEKNGKNIKVIVLQPVEL